MKTTIEADIGQAMDHYVQFNTYVSCLQWRVI